MRAVKRKNRIEKEVFVTQAKSFPSVHSADEIAQLGDMKNLSCLSIIRFDQPAEFLLTADGTLSHGDEVFVKDGVIPPDATMRALGQIVRNPCFHNVIELPPAKADEVVQALVFECPDKRFRVCFCLLQRGQVFHKIDQLRDVHLTLEVRRHG